MFLCRLNQDKGDRITALKQAQEELHQTTDILKSYKLGVNCYVTKPIGLKEFIKIVSSIENFWFTIVQLPPQEKDK